MPDSKQSARLLRLKLQMLSILHFLHTYGDYFYYYYVVNFFTWFGSQTEKQYHWFTWVYYMMHQVCDSDWGKNLICTYIAANPKQIKTTSISTVWFLWLWLQHRLSQKGSAGQCVCHVTIQKRKIRTSPSLSAHQPFNIEDNILH